MQSYRRYFQWYIPKQTEIMVEWIEIKCKYFASNQLAPVSLHCDKSTFLLYATEKIIEKEVSIKKKHLNSLIKSIMCFPRAALSHTNF